MAKKGDIDLDDINFDNDDFDFDFDITPPKDDRNPVKKLASGAVKGFKSEIKNPKFIKDKVLETLPPGYSKAADLLDQVGYELSDLYNSAAKDLEPVRKLGVKVSKSALPKLKGKLPKKIEDRLQAIIDADESNKTAFKIDQDQANMNLELGEIFKTQMEHQEQLNQKRDEKETVKAALDFKKHKESLTELASVRQGIDKLVGYQDSINFKFQKKSLELQFKQYYIQRDQLELSRTTNKAVIESLQGIMKNTGLPEFVKVQTVETGKQMLKERMLKSLGGTAAEFAPNFIKNFKENIKRRMQTELSALSSMASMGDMMDMGSMRDMGVDPTEMFGEMGGAAGANYLANSLIYRHGNKIPGMKKFNKLGNKLSRSINDLPAMMSEFAESPTKGMGAKSEAVRFLKSLIPNFDFKTILETDNIQSLDRATHFDSHTRKSIVEIIPGYLARILQSIDIMRTGNENSELINYDLTSNRFVTKSTLKSNLMNRMFSKTSIGKADSNTEYVLSHLDPNKMLDEKTRKILKSQMLSDSQQNKRISIDRYMKEGEYSSFVDPESRTKLINFFSQLNDNADGEGSFKEELSRRSRGLLDSIPNTREMAQLFVSAGYGDMLEETGVTNKAGGMDNLNFNKIMQVYREGTDSLVGNGGGSGRRRRPRTFTPTPSGSSSSYDSLGPDASLNEIVADLKASVIAAMLDGKGLDEQRNIKLDEIIIRMEGLGVDGVNTGPGTKSFKARAASISSKMKGTSKSLYSKAKNFTKKYFDTVGGIAGSTLKFTRDVAAGGIKGIKDSLFKKVQDVYVNGDLLRVKLKASKMRAGDYIDEVTGKVIKSVDDIKGRVKDKITGEIVLDFEDINKGLVNSRGEKIRNMVSKFVGNTLDLMSKVAGGSFDVTKALISIPGAIAKGITRKLSGIFEDKDILVPGEKAPRLTVGKLRAGEYFDAVTGKVLTSFKDIKNGVKDKEGNTILGAEEISRGVYFNDGTILKNVIKLPGKILGGIFELNKRILTGGAKVLGKLASKFKGNLSPEAKQVLLLTEIRDILDDRLADSTTDRAGSAGDIIARRKAKGKIASAMGIPGKDKKGKEGKDGGGLLDTLGNLGSALSGLTSMMGGLIKGIGKMGGLLGRGVMGAGSLLLSGGGALLSGAATAGSMALTAAGAVGSAVATGASALVATLGLPVIAGIAAVGAVAYGGYKLYKYLKKKGAWLTKVRMAQYGMNPEKSNEVEKMGDLENLLMKKVTITAGNPDIKFDKDLVEDILDIFGLEQDEKEKDKIKMFSDWFLKRFKPIFLAHIKATDRFAKGSNMGEADDNVPLKNKLDYIKMTSFGGGENSPYSIAASPFDFANTLPVGEGHVKQYVDQAIAYYKKEMEKEGIKPSVESSGKAVAGATAAATSVAAMNNKQAGLQTSSVGRALNSLKVGATFLAEKLFTYSPIGLFDGLTGGKLKDLLFGKTQKIDALLAVRLKCYGLKDFEKSSQMSALITLETTTLNKCKLGKDGEVQIPLNEEQVFKDHASNFDLDPTSPSDFGKFIVWFRSRFLPVITKYFSVVKAIDPTLTINKADEKLKPSQKAVIGKELLNTKTAKDSGMSIWEITESPFPKTEMNTEASSCKEHIEFLQKQTSEQETKAQGAVVKAAATTGTAAAATSMFSNVKDKMKGFFKSAQEKAGEYLDKAKDAYAGAVDATSRGMERAAGAAGSAVQAARDTVSGIGFDFGSLPKGKDTPIKGDSKKNIGIMLKEMAAAGINSVQEKAMMLGQLAHESGDFTKLSENLNYRVDVLLNLFKSAKKAGRAAVEAAVKSGPAAIAEIIYGRRMGNTEPGDGYKYRGRGFIQLTGKDNYIATGKRLGIDLVNNPDLASDPQIAAKIAIDYWKNRVGAAGASGDIKAVTYKINGGYNGLQDRAAKYASYLKKFESGEMDKIAGEAANDSGKTDTSVGPTGTPPPSSIALPAAQGAAPSAPPALLAKDQPKQSAVSGLMNMNPFDVSGLTGAPGSSAVAANTSNVTKAAEQTTDQQAYQSNVNQDYQAVSMDVQRKASGEYLNGGIDKVGGVLAEQLNVQRSIDSNIKRLVDVISSGNLGSTMQPQQPTLQSAGAATPPGQSQLASQARGPVSMKRVNV